MNEEQMIRKIEGERNPFRVPEGYFETFNERLAKQLPQMQTPKTVRLKPRWWRYAAAAIVLLGIGVAIFTNKYDIRDIAQSDEVAQEEYYNEALDYFMVDNMEIAESLTEADY